MRSGLLKRLSSRDSVSVGGTSGDGVSNGSHNEQDAGTQAAAMKKEEKYNVIYLGSTSGSSPSSKGSNASKGSPHSLGSHIGQFTPTRRRGSSGISVSSGGSKKTPPSPMSTPIRPKKKSPFKMGSASPLSSSSSSSRRSTPSKQSLASSPSSRSLVSLPSTPSSRGSKSAASSSSKGSNKNPPKQRRSSTPLPQRSPQSKFTSSERSKPHLVEYDSPSTGNRKTISEEALNSLTTSSPSLLPSILGDPHCHTASAPDYDCPICLDTLTEYDDAHPLQCSNACGYNFCLNCIESFIESSKDDYGVASDGSRQVKVFLMCPKCRSDLSTTIRDTALLRKADHIEACVSGRCGTNKEEWEELTPSELRMKGVMDDVTVKNAIGEARRREAAFFGKKLSFAEMEEKTTETTASSISLPTAAELLRVDTSYEEMGVEVDVQMGVHQSMRWMRQPSYSPSKLRRGTAVKVDTTLLAGLEYAMTQAEKETCTDLLTSGDAFKLSIAAELLHGLMNLTRVGKVSSAQDNNNNNSTEARRAAYATGNTAAVSPRSRGAQSSVFNLIEESEKAREKEGKKIGTNGESAGTRKQQQQLDVGQTADELAHNPRRNVNTPAGRITASQHRAAELSIRRAMEHQRRFPLPVRMPKYVEIALHDPSSKRFGLFFCNDVWDGTLLDAFTKITIGFGGKVKKKEPNHKGVFRILNMDPDDDGYANPRIDTDQPRVLVASATAEAGRQGVVKGDVVTHVNGEEFRGNKEDLEGLIREIVQQEDTQVLTLVLNAEHSIAEALRRRALIID